MRYRFTEEIQFEMNPITDFKMLETFTVHYSRVVARNRRTAL